MTVTDIMPITKSRYRIVLDEELTFVLYKGEMNRLHIQRGEEIMEDTYLRIFHEILPKRAKLRCMNLLQSKDYTHRQLEDKLKKGEYPEEIIEDAIAYVESYGYVDDEKYVRNFIEYNMSKKSRMRIENDLMRKGVRRDLIGKIFDELKESGTEIDEIAMIQKLLLKKNYNSKSATDEERRKMYAFLSRRGFGSDVIGRALLLDIT
ncbi:MAG: recombination regulator RecX [Lachnospiraceae bacterium]|nr:recombination regulator RecX [Lachnospiraceae bacterium]